MPSYEYRIVLDGTVIERGIFERDQARSLAHGYGAEVEQRLLDGSDNEWEEI